MILEVYMHKCITIGSPTTSAHPLNPLCTNYLLPKSLESSICLILGSQQLLSIAKLVMAFLLSVVFVLNTVLASPGLWVDVLIFLLMQLLSMPYTSFERERPTMQCRQWEWLGIMQEGGSLYKPCIGG